MTNPANSAVHLPQPGRPVRAVRPRVRRHRHVERRRRLAKQVGGQRQLPECPAHDHRRRGQESGTYDAFIELAGIEDDGARPGRAGGQGRVAADRLPVQPERQRDHPGRSRGPTRRSASSGSPTPTSRATRSRRSRSTVAAAASSPRRRRSRTPPTRSRALSTSTSTPTRLATNAALAAFVNYYVSDAGITAVDRRGLRRRSRSSDSRTSRQAGLRRVPRCRAPEGSCGVTDGCAEGRGWVPGRRPSRAASAERHGGHRRRDPARSSATNGACAASDRLPCVPRPRSSRS